MFDLRHGGCYPRLLGDQLPLEGFIVPRTRTLLGWILLVVLCGTCGCCRSRQFWREPGPPSLSCDGSSCSALIKSGCRHHRPDCESQLAARRAAYAVSRDPLLAFELAEAYARLAVAAEKKSPCNCPDLYYHAAAFSWAALRDGTASTQHWHRAREIYHASVARMLITARGNGLQIFSAGGPVRIPLAICGFSWHQDDFQQFYPVGDYKASIISRRHRSPGWGVPVVVRRPCRTHEFAEESFLIAPAVFAATVVLRPDLEQVLFGESVCATGAVLEFHNPLSVKTVRVNGGEMPLAHDISGPFAFRAITEEQTQDAFSWFVNASRVSEDGLFLIEPYQRGKIPVVFAHGLLSNPATWMDMANDLRAIPGFMDHYQVWGYRYATGGPFLYAATVLRRDLARIVATVDPEGQDQALRQMVLVGHSMGGLVAKLQVVNSGDRLWRAAAKRSLDQIAADAKTRGELAELFFFAPNTGVRRVVFIATPHQGSPWASRPTGKFAAHLVRSDPADVDRHRRLVAANPGVFSKEIQGRIPTSIDMLESDSPMLRTIRCLPVAPHVRVHSIIGTGRPLPRNGPGDGVVSITSASYPGSVSQFAVAADHLTVHRDPRTTEEVARILRVHLMEMACESP